jgi:MoaA/NifB/PqqE/SkfB family radical SAM enzyme
MTLRSLAFDSLTSLGLILGRRPLCGPRVVQLNISDECNLDCVMCNRSISGVGGFLEAERVRELVAELYRLGLRELFYHGYGEPMLHPKIAELFRSVSARHRGLRQFIVTNGTCLSNANIAAMAEGRVSARISVHAGDRDTWARVNPSSDPRLFDAIARGAARLAGGGRSEVELLFVLQRANIDGIDAMLELAATTGAGRVLFRPMRLYNGRDGRPMNDHLLLDRDQHRSAVAAIARGRERHRGRFVVDSVPFDVSVWSDGLGRPSSLPFYDRRACLLGWVFSLILRDGTVLGCLEESFDRPLGNVREQSFRSIWWSDAYQAFRRQQRFDDRAGLDATSCLGWCQHLATNRRLNDIKRLRPLSYLRHRRSATG